MFSSIIATGFTVAFFHAIIPTHWLPFVIASRTQKWTKLKTLSVTALAGAGHVLITSLLGVAVVLMGFALDGKAGEAFPFIAGGALMALGSFYLIRYFKGQGHEHGHIHLLGEHHHHESVLCFKGEHGGVLINTGHQLIEVTVGKETPCRLQIYFFDETAQKKNPPTPESVTLKLIQTIDCEDGKAQTAEDFSFTQNEDHLESSMEWKHPSAFEAIIYLKHQDHSHEYRLKYNSELETNEVTVTSAQQKNKSDRLAIISLLTLLTFSPCESFLPVYLSGVQYGWWGFLILSLVLGIATLLAMVIFTWLALTGIEKMKLHWIEKHESAIMGTALLILGLVVMFLED
jgi:hypothetical protein